ncbi:MAG: sulfotransferase [Myxococcota bacterium]
MNETTPNFLMVGAAKSGTTSLYRYLREHPEIFMPSDKEPNYFVRSLRSASEEEGEIGTLKDYLALYTGTEGFAARGDACVHNLYYFKIAIPEIRKCLGDVKIIIALRNPVDRAWSQYSSMSSNRRFDSFESCLKFESDYFSDSTETSKPSAAIRTADWSDRNVLYMSWGMYYEQVKAYLDNFTDVQIVLFEDLRQDPIRTMTKLYQFLGVDDQYAPNVGESYNASITPRNLAVGQLMQLYRKLRIGDHLTTVLTRFSNPDNALRLKAKLFASVAPIASKKSSMQLETRSNLKNRFRSDISALQTLIKRDLSFWL